jgi:predicted nucleic acid-binding protein
VVCPVRGILDTSVVIATDITPLEGELAISAVTLAELRFGVLVAKNPQRSLLSDRQHASSIRRARVLVA